MHSTIFTTLISLAVAGLLPEVSALPTSQSCGSPPAKSGKAIYLISNDKENKVVSLPISRSGLLSGGRSVATGGAGSNSIVGTTKQPAAPDALLSQAALTIAGDNLFAVNAGSNSVTMFAIDPRDPTKLTKVGYPAAVGAEFPNTVAASAKHKLVCVGSTGAKAGISCAPFSHRGIGKMDSLREFDLQQSTPPVGPTNTVSQVFFSNDEDTLFTTVKGDPTKNNTGFLGAFRVNAACDGKAASVSEAITKSSPNGTAVLFGSGPIPNSNDLFVTDASFGAAILSVDAKSDESALKAKTVIQGQKATCWVAISPATDSAFVTDVGVNRLIEVSLADASVKSVTDLSANGDPGLIDLRVGGEFVYALSPGNGTTPAAVTVLDVQSKKQVQHFKLNGLGVDKNAQGMALLQ